jgi:hypothetical protein
MNLKENEKVFTSKFVGTGPSSYEEKRIYRAAVSQRLRNIALDYLCLAIIRPDPTAHYSGQSRIYCSKYMSSKNILQSINIVGCSDVNDNCRFGAGFLSLTTFLKSP